jgi:hypothetical protein
MTVFCMLRLTVLWVLFLPNGTEPVNAKLTLGVVQQETTYHRMLKPGKQLKKGSDASSQPAPANNFPSFMPSQTPSASAPTMAPTIPPSTMVPTIDPIPSTSSSSSPSTTCSPVEEPSIFATSAPVVDTSASAPSMAPTIPPNTMVPLTLSHPPPLQAAPAPPLQFQISLPPTLQL